MRGSDADCERCFMVGGAAASFPQDLTLNRRPGSVFQRPGLVVSKQLFSGQMTGTGLRPNRA